MKVGTTVDSGSRRCALIVNPTKVSDDFADLMRSTAERLNWELLWLETTEDDPGRGMARQALEEGVDRVVAAGGDGTVRCVADALAQSGTVLGLVPAGTGNLLARNLGLPLTEPEAVEIALGEQTRAIDLIKLVVDDGEPQHFAVMAGVGIDALIMEETNPALKARVGSAAYFMAAGKALGRLPMSIRVKVDQHRTHRRTTMLALIGNVSQLTAGITLIPGAEPDDGRLDVYIASPHRFTHWLRILLRLITRRQHRGDQVDQWSGRRVTVQLAEPDLYQLDGDVIGECRSMVAEIVPGALTVCVGPR